MNKPQAVETALVAADASSLYARNVLDFLKLVVDKDAATRLLDTRGVTTSPRTTAASSGA